MNTKEDMIKKLEEELEREKKRREEMAMRFRKEVEEFESERDALERIRAASMKMEKRH